MRWQSNKSRLQHSATTIDPFKSINQLTKDSMKRTRALSEEQVYSKMHYEDEVRPKYEAECLRLGLSTKAKKERMAVRRKLTKESWEEVAKDEERRRQVVEEKARLAEETTKVQSSSMLYAPSSLEPLSSSSRVAK